MSAAAPRVMLVAGGTGAIGGEIAAHALRDGWHVALHGRSAESVSAALLRHDAGARCRGIAADLAVLGAVPHIVRQAADWHGRLDAVVDCVAAGAAGMRVTGPIAGTDPAGYAALLDLSVAHLQRLAFAALPRLARQGGTLIAFASDAGRFAAPRQSLIGASRGAIIAFVRNLALETARDAVTMHCVSPGFVAGTGPLDEIATARRDRAAARAGLGLPTPRRHRRAGAVPLRPRRAARHRAGDQRQWRHQRLTLGPETETPRYPDRDGAAPGGMTAPLAPPIRLTGTGRCRAARTSSDMRRSAHPHR